MEWKIIKSNLSEQTRRDIGERDVDGRQGVEACDKQVPKLGKTVIICKCDDAYVSYLHLIGLDIMGNQCCNTRDGRDVEPEFTSIS